MSQLHSHKLVKVITPHYKNIPLQIKVLHLKFYLVIVLFVFYLNESYYVALIVLVEGFCLLSIHVYVCVYVHVSVSVNVLYVNIFVDMYILVVQKCYQQNVPKSIKNPSTPYAEWPPVRTAPVILLYYSSLLHQSCKKKSFTNIAG